MTSLSLVSLSLICTFVPGLTSRKARRPSAAPRNVAPHHVTRLHRHEQGGLAAMLEAEARWESLSEEEPVPLTGSLVEVSVARDVEPPRRFSRMSTQQMTWLREHQMAVFAQMDGSTAAASSGTSRDTRSGANLRAVRSHKPQSQPVQDQEVDTASNASTVTSLSSIGAEYVGPVGVGTVQPAEGCNETDSGCHTEESEIWMVFDTGSVNIWVSSDLCTQGPCVKANRSRYNHSESDSYESMNKTLQVKFGTGKLTGPLAVDDFHIGPFTVHNQTFAMIENMDGAVFDTVPLEGILGLAFPAMAPPNNTPFFDTIINQKALPHNQFAFYFSVDNPSANAVLWGGVDSGFYTGEIEYFPVVEQWYWSIALKSFRIGDAVLVGNASNDESNSSAGNETASLVESNATGVAEWKAIIDTGTTFITAGDELYQAILEKVPEGPCANITEDTYPSMVFQFENEAGVLKDFVLGPHEYMVTDGGDRCSLAFMQLEIGEKHGPGMIFGDVFLRRFFSVFDRGDGEGSHNGRVGFARATHGDAVDRHLKKLTKGQPSFRNRA